MIKALISSDPKVLLVVEKIPSNKWIVNGEASYDGLGDLLGRIFNSGISRTNISIVNLADTTEKKVKAAAFKEKAAYIGELIATISPNVVVPIGAEAFNQIVGFKGQSKYIGRALYSNRFPNTKVIPIQDPIQERYDPRVAETIAETINVIKVECEFPEVTPKVKEDVKYYVLDTISKVDKFFDFYISGKISYFTVDTETKGTNAFKGELLTIQFSHAPKFSYLIKCPFYKTWTDGEWTHIKSRLSDLFRRTEITCVGHNLKYDLKWLHVQAGVPLRKVNTFCTMAASFLCDETKPNGLKENVIEICPELGDYEQPMHDWIDNYCAKSKPKLRKKDFTYDLIPEDLLIQYALVDTDATARLYEYYKVKLQEEDQVEVHAMVMRFLYFFLKCEVTGWPVNIPYCLEYQKELAGRIAEMEQELFDTPVIKKAYQIVYRQKLAKENAKLKTPKTELKKFEFKLGSNPNKQIIFFDILKLPSIKKTKSGGRATDKNVINAWVVDHPQHADFLLKYREWGNLTKLKSTYVDMFVREEFNGRIYPTYSATSARSGRSASRSPNFQNIPVHSKEGKRVKQAIEAPEGKILIGSDLQACEMRLFALYSNDSSLIQVFEEGLDIHGKVCKDIFPYVDCEINEVKSKYKFERDEVSKKVGFGSIYGIAGKGLARNINDSLISQVKDGKLSKDEFEQLKYSEKDAQHALDMFFKACVGGKQWIDDTYTFIKKHGYSISLLGRKRRVPAVYSKDEYIQAEALRQATNSPIQSLGSDILLINACNLLDEIEEKSLNINMLGGVHDALYLCINEEDRDEVVTILLRHMKNMPIPNSPVKMDASAEWGKNWNSFSEDFGTAIIDEEDDQEDNQEDEEEAT